MSESEDRRLALPPKAAHGWQAHPCFNSNTAGWRLGTENDIQQHVKTHQHCRLPKGTSFGVLAPQTEPVDAAVGAAAASGPAGVFPPVAPLPLAHRCCACCEAVART